ncbi:MAG: rhomboid family intramembrane serine protease [Pseudomonadota bacterium]
MSADGELWPGWRVVLRGRDYQRLADRAFVLTALDLPCEWARDPQGALMLLVPEPLAAHALEQIVRYEAEHQGGQDRWGTGADTLARPRQAALGARFGAMALVLTLVFFAFAQTTFLGSRDWLEAGRLQAGLVRDGEWWRVFTALTLHLDMAHLLGNLVFGVVFGFIASLSLGSGAAWLTILLCGAAGNLLNAWLQPISHSAVGASTGVFAALGLIAAFQWRVQLAQAGERWLRRLGPVVAGVALLAFLGVGDERTDVGAHLTGFLCGLGGGWAWGEVLRRQGPPSMRAQWTMAGVAPTLLALAWWIAFAS